MASANLLGIFGSLDAAGSAMQALIHENVPVPSLNVLAHAGGVRFAPHADQTKFGRIELLNLPGDPGGPAGVEVILTGAEIPDIGPVLAMGELVLADSELLNFQAGILGKMFHLGVSEVDAKRFLNAVRQGYTVLGVECPMDQSQVVAEVLGHAKLVALQDALVSSRPHVKAQHWYRSGFRSPNSPLWDVALFLPGLPGEPQFPKPGHDPQKPTPTPPQTPPQTPPRLPPNVHMYL
jgi:hypothetical protein